MEYSAPAMATINIPQYFASKFDVKSSCHVSGESLKDCLTALVQAYPKLDLYIFNREGLLSSALTIYINKTFPADGLDTRISDNSVIDIVANTAGG